MAVTDLVFRDPPVVGQPVNLVFGASETPILINTTVGMVAALPALTGSVRAAIGVKVAAAGVLPAITGNVLVSYLSGSPRPLISNTSNHWQKAQTVESGAQALYNSTLPLPKFTQQYYQPAAPTQFSAKAAHSLTARLQRAAAVRHQHAQCVNTATLAALHADADRSMRKMLAAAFQEAERLQTREQKIAHEDALRDRRQSADSRWQPATPISILSESLFGTPTHLVVRRVPHWQEGMRPPAGTSVTVVVPVFDPCYLPDPNLVFSELLSNDTGLLFYCERRPIVVPPISGDTVVVPIRKVYVVLNTASLRRVDGNLQIGTFGMSLSLDVDSWTWQFSASMPAQMLSLLEPSALGDPVEVEAMVNGSPYRMLVESISRERVFGQSSIRVSGRGIAATLDAPYAPVQTFSNSGARTAQQLMDDVLTINGVSLGWTVNWGLTDWLVPAGVFNHNGSYISAINSIAAAAGGYLQPSGIGKVLNVLPRYKAAPWDWATAITPDYQLPADLMTRESIEWVERARYNRVFVSGQGQGVLGQVSRAGTAGDQVAPMIVDALITHADAARQRGQPVLANTGRIANIGLKLPVLAETNIITPGKYVDFVDSGITRRGVVRSVQVEVGMPEVWQTIGVETHA